METYKEALKAYADWLVALPMEEKYVVRRYMVQDISHSGVMESFIHEDTALRHSEAQLDEILSRYEKVEELSSWQKQAERQVFVQEAVALLKKGVEKVQPLKDVAVTICPQEGTLEAVQRIAALVTTLTCMKNGGHYVFEQRSDCAPAHGWHIHMNVKTVFRPSKIHQYITQKLSAAKSHTSFIVCKQADAKWLTHYMRGVKGDTSKDPKSAYDKVVRRELNLQDEYAF